MPFQLCIQNQRGNGQLNLFALSINDTDYEGTNLPQPWGKYAALKEDGQKTESMADGKYIVEFRPDILNGGYRMLQFEVKSHPTNGIAPEGSNLGHGDFNDKYGNRWHPCQGSPDCVTISTKALNVINQPKKKKK